MSIQEQDDIQDGAQDDDPQDEGPSVEERAAMLGWKPETEYRGPEGKFVDAEEFIQRGEEVLPILRNNVRALEGKIHDLQRGVAAREEYFTMQLEAQRKENERKMREAVESGDMEAFDDAKKSLDDMPEAPQPAPNTDPQRAFMESNSWYGANNDMTVYANGESARLAATQPNLTQEQNLAMTAQNTVKAFDKPAARTAVETKPRRSGARGSGKKDFASMPSAEREKFESMMRAQGSAIHDKDKFRADVAKTYYASQENE